MGRIIYDDEVTGGCWTKLESDLQPGQDRIYPDELPNYDIEPVMDRNYENYGG